MYVVSRGVTVDLVDPKQLGRSIEWEDAGMDRLHGAAEAIEFVRSKLWTRPTDSFDAAFTNQ